MDEPTVDNVIKRLERLEQQNRVLKVAVIALLVLTIGACEFAQTPKKAHFSEVRAGSFILDGGKNKQLATLNGFGLTLYGPAANIILRNIDEEGWPDFIPKTNQLEHQPYISLLGHNGGIQLSLGHLPENGRPANGPFLSISNHSKFRDPTEEDSVELSVGRGKPSLNLYKDGNFIWGTPW
jgi:hypothetical protein